MRTIAITSDPTAHIRLGCVLVNLGRLEEGQAILLANRAGAKHPLDKILANIFLSVAAYGLGDHKACLIYAYTARAINTQSPCLARLPDISQIPSEP